MKSNRDMMFLSLTVPIVVFSILLNARPNQKSPCPVYTDAEFGFQISLPDSGWSYTDSTGFSKVLLIIKSGKIVDGFIPNLSITAEFLPHMLSAEQYAQNNLDCLEKQGFEVQEKGKIIIHNNLFYDLKCFERHESPPLQFRYLCIVKDQIGYTITCTAPAEHYAKFNRVFEHTVKSFRFI
jgi:hypothetical protein